MVTLREFRKAKGLTLVQMGAKLGVHFTTVQKWESGERIPGGADIAAIESATDGQVRAATFVSARDARVTAPAGAAA